MEIFKSVESLQSYIEDQKIAGKTIGFGPTMGALHEGHMTLMAASRRLTDITVCSIFVNPTQFNNATDLEKYPITIEEDIELLKANKVGVLFLPSKEEVYPSDLDTSVNIDLDGMEKVMEGEFRPGHFEGVMQVVNRLLDIVQPDYLFMGQKDFQQFSIIQKMIRELSLSVKLQVVPIKRRKSGLAMSSRNKRLSNEQIKVATIINKTLKYSRLKLKKGHSISNVKAYAMNRLERSGFKPEYVSISDMNSLKDIESYEKSMKVVVSLAAWLGEVRLIDNIIV